MASSEIYQKPVQWLGLSPRSHNSLARAHIATVGELLAMSDEDLLEIRNFGPKPLEELRNRLAEMGIPRHWGGPKPDNSQEDF